MKKYIMLMLMAIMATTAFAEKNPVSLLPDSRVIAAKNEPIFTFFAVDTTSTVLQRLPNNHVFSRERLNERFCWQVSGLPVNKHLYNVDLELIAPNMTWFVAADGKRMRGVSNVTNLQLEAVEGRIMECGGFESNDPAGKYRLIVTVEGKSYPMQTMILR